MKHQLTQEQLEKRLSNTDARLGLAQEWIAELEADVANLEWLLGFEKDSQSKLNIKLLQEIDNIYLDEAMHEDDKIQWIWQAVQSRYKEQV